LSLAPAIVKSLLGAEDYQRQTLEIVCKVALTKTGGFLGFGGRSVIDETEQAALNQLAASMGV
jgi:hypothetical protein